MNKLFSLLCIFSLFIAPALLYADTSEIYTLSGLPGFESGSQNTQDFPTFINSIYRMSIGIGAALAVIMIIFAGIQYSMSAVGSVKENMRQRITMALGGLGLLIGAFVFLEFINPGLTDLRIDNDLEVSDTSSTDIIEPGEVEVAEIATTTETTTGQQQ